MIRKVLIDLDPYAEQTTEDLGASGLFDLSKALVRIKALQDRSVTQEGVISRLRKQNETLTNEQDQYKGALHTLNKEVMTLTEKLKEEARLRKKAQKGKANLESKLTAICGQVEMAKANAIIEFKASQPFIDACAVYNGDEFKDCLKQFRSIYLNLDLSKVTIDDPLPTTPIGDNTINEETDDSI
nr:hypothetical protein CFP56_22824 [Quercus suber]